MSFQERLAKSLKKFGTTVWFRIVYLVILGLVLTALFPFTFAGSTACLILLLMPVTMFIFPYWIGERNGRRFLVNGVVIFVIAILAISAFQSSAVLGSDPVELQSIPDPSLDNTMHLANGTVTPFHASSPTTYTFRVNLTTDASGNPSDFSVYVNLTIIDGFNRDYHDYPLRPEAGSNNTKNGTWYSTTQSLGTSIYGFGFFVKNLNTNNWTATGPVLGPISGSFPAYFGFFAYYTVLLLLIPLTFYYLILFMWWYSARARTARQKMAGQLEPSKAGKGTKPVVGDKAAKAAAFTCTNCGADVTEADEKCPKCGAVFED